MKGSHPNVPTAWVRGGLPAYPYGEPLSPTTAHGDGAAFGGWREDALSPCTSVLGLKLQYLSLSAVPSSPMPTPQPLPASPEPTAAARQLDELLADLGQMQSKVSRILGQAVWGRLEPIPHPPRPGSWQLWGKEPEHRWALHTRWTTCWVA